MVAATISLARSAAEAELLGRSLAVLAQRAVSTFVTDGGSSARFVDTIAALPRTQVLAASGLVPQVKMSMAAALDSGATRLLYTEPDKLTFFKKQLNGIVERCDSMPARALILVARSSAALDTFPRRQRVSERRFNRECGAAFGMAGDYCYGPFVVPGTVAALVAGCPDDLGWGWRPFTFAMAHRLGYPLQLVTGEFVCPPDQRREAAGGGAYRDRQLAENRRGLALGLAAPLPMSR
jgi:hypothetical protein